MHHLRLIPSLNPDAGGTVVAVELAAAELARRGISTTITCLDAANSPWLLHSAEAADGLVKRLGLGPCRGFYGYRKGLANQLLPLVQQADLVIIEGMWQYHALAGWRALRRLGPAAPPYWVYPHGMLDPWFKRTYPLKHLKKWLYWPWADYRVLRDAAAVCFTSEQERLLARQSFWLYSAREQVLPLGVAQPPGHNDAQLASSQRRAFAERFPALAGQRLILSLARLHEKKGLDLLVEAFAPLARHDPSLHLMLAGPATGPAGANLRARLEEMARRLGIERQLHLPGLLQGELKWGALRSAEIFALPSHQENFGIAVVEALACGLPVLISTAVNICAEVQAAGAGLVQPDNLAATSAALERWQALDPLARAAMGAAASRLFAERYELGASADCLLALLGAGR